jgi:hypothetical protein
MRYRLVVGESGNERGHVVPSSTKTIQGARIALGRALAHYSGDGWGTIQCLRTPATEAVSGRDEWDTI